MYLMIRILLSSSLQVSGEMATANSTVCSWGYVILVSKFVILFIDTGIAKSFGVLIPTMVERFESDYATVGLICSMPATLLCLASPFVVLVVQKANHRFVAMSGGVLSGSCILACAFFKNTVSIGVFLALSGVGLSMTFMPIMMAINNFFPEKFIFVNTLTCYGYTAGSMLLPVVTERALQAYGYTGAFIILGGISLNLVVCGATTRQVPRNVDTNKQGKGHDEQDEELTSLTVGDASEQGKDITYQEENDDNGECILKPRCVTETERRSKHRHESSPNAPSSWMTSAFLTCKRSCGLLNEPLYLFSLPINFLIYYTMYAWMMFLVPHAEYLGIAPSKAIFLSTIGGIGGIIGRTFFLILVFKRINVFSLYSAIGTICTTSFLLDFTSSAFKVRAVMAFVQGFSFFIEDTVMASLFKEAIFDDRNFDMAVGVSGFICGIGVTCAGSFTGYLFDITQSFTKVFIIIGFIHAVIVGYLIIVAILIKRRQ